MTMKKRSWARITLEHPSGRLEVFRVPMAIAAQVASVSRRIYQHSDVLLSDAAIGDPIRVSRESPLDHVREHFGGTTICGSECRVCGL
jgi:hypothetical protein